MYASYRFFLICFALLSISFTVCSISATMQGHWGCGYQCAGFSIVALYLSILVQPQPVLKPWTYEDLLELRPHLSNWRTNDHVQP